MPKPKKHKLKPCPFCHSTETEIVISGPCDPEEHDFVRCEWCGARGPESAGRYHSAKDWNARKPEDWRREGQLKPRIFMGFKNKKKENNYGKND